MLIFTVQALNKQGETLSEVDVPLTQFWPLADNLETHLRKQGLFNSEDEIVQRLVPETTLPENHIDVKIEDKVQLKLSKQKQDVHLQMGIEELYTPLKALSIWLYALERQRKCSIRLSTHDLFRSACEHLLQKSLSSASTSEAAEIAFRIFLQGDDFDVATESSSSTKQYQMIVVDPASGLQETVTGEQHSSKLHLQSAETSTVKLTSVLQPRDRGKHSKVSVGYRESIVTPRPQTLDHYNTEMIGKRREGQLRILIKKRSLADLKRSVELHETHGHDIAGLLMGRFYQDEAYGLFLDINNVLGIRPSNVRLFKQGTEKEKWSDILEDAKLSDPQNRLIGWYRARWSKAARQSPSDAQQPNTTQSVLDEVRQAQSNLMPEEVVIHRQFFAEFWNVAAIFNLRQGRLVFYQWLNDEVSVVDGYYVYEE